MYSVFQSSLRSAGAGETDCGQCEADLPCLQLYRQEGGKEGGRKEGRKEREREGKRKKPSFPPYELLLALVIAGPAGTGETVVNVKQICHAYSFLDGRKEGSV